MKLQAVFTLSLVISTLVPSIASASAKKAEGRVYTGKTVDLSKTLPKQPKATRGTNWSDNPALKNNNIQGDFRDGNGILHESKPVKKAKSSSLKSDKGSVLFAFKPASNPTFEGTPTPKFVKVVKPIVKPKATPKLPLVKQNLDEVKK